MSEGGEVPESSDPLQPELKATTEQQDSSESEVLEVGLASRSFQGQSETPTADEPRSKRLRKIVRQLREHRVGITLWWMSTLLSFFIGVWLTGIMDCIPKAKKLVSAAVESVGYLGQGEECFFLPPVDSGGNETEFMLASKAIAGAESALKDCRLRCSLGDCCSELKRDLKLAKANLSLLSGRCEEALADLESLRRDGGLVGQGVITWAWAKVETSPNVKVLEEVLLALSKGPDSACLATTRGSLLRRLALLKESEGDKLLHKALNEHEKAMSLNPRSVLVNYNRAIVLFNLGEIDKAQAALDSAADYLGGRSDPYWHQAQAQIHYTRGFYLEALADLNAAVETGYPDPGFRLSRGWGLLKLDRPREAKRDFERAKQMILREETSCRTDPQDDLRAEVEWGLALAQYKDTGAISVDTEALRKALTPAVDPQLRSDIEANLAFIDNEIKETSIPKDH